MPYHNEFIRVESGKTIWVRAQCEVVAWQIQRTRASPFDAYVGILCELG
ncbi:MAG: hypothetical protein WCL57_16250 [Chloroflexota bacterium]|jgi:hypothetical protein|nr:hypothetical protein [Chloroflexota bacterium]